jgi:hypothetical protein
MLKPQCAPVGMKYPGEVDACDVVEEDSDLVVAGPVRVGVEPRTTENRVRPQRRLRATDGGSSTASKSLFRVGDGRRPSDARATT